MSSKRMTANPVRPAPYRTGKPVAEEPSSDDEYESQEEGQSQQRAVVPSPKATSFPRDAAKLTGNLKNVDLNERRQQAAAEEARRLEAEKAARLAEEEGFETEESEEEEADSDEDLGSENGIDSEETSSEDEAPKKLLRPTFIKKDKRTDGTAVTESKTDEELWVRETAKRKEKVDSMIQEQLERNAAAQAAGKKDWDDDEIEEVQQVDDTDDIDPETERAAWKLRELKRVKREREIIEQAEKAREEIERRRNLSKEEREAEDQEFLGTQKEEREGKGKMGYLQKYFHRGAFFQDDAKAEGLDRRDIMGSRYQDDVSNRELLPQYMQIRDMTLLGRKGRTKYKDLKSEDTGKWGIFDRASPRGAGGTLDQRFMPDREVGMRGASGVNTIQTGERRKAEKRVPEDSRSSGSRESFQDEGRRKSTPRRSQSRSRDPPRRRSLSYSGSPPPQRDHQRRLRRHSKLYSRSPPPGGDHYKDHQPRTKRSLSPHDDRYARDKRRRMHAS